MEARDLSPQHAKEGGGAMALADKVKELRQKLEWKQVTLALKSGIPQATISRIESGKVTQPKMGQLRKLADALETTIDYLAGDSMQMSEDIAWNHWRWLETLLSKIYVDAFKHGYKHGVEDANEQTVIDIVEADEEI